MAQPDNKFLAKARRKSQKQSSANKPVQLGKVRIVQRPMPKAWQPVDK